jgi:hypothetical protein
MDCKRANELLMEYLYQELEPTQMDQFESHLKGCSACTGELAGYESTRQVMRQLPEVEPSPQLNERLMQQAAAAIRPQRPSFFDRLREGMRVMVLHPAMTAAVMLVVVVGISFFAYQRHSPLMDQPRPDELAPSFAPTPLADETSAAEEKRADPLGGLEDLQEQERDRAHAPQGVRASRFDLDGKDEATASIATGQTEQPAPTSQVKVAAKPRPARTRARRARGGLATKDSLSTGRRRLSVSGEQVLARQMARQMANQAPREMPQKEASAKPSTDNRRFVGTRGLWKPSVSKSSPGAEGSIGGARMQKAPVRAPAPSMASAPMDKRDSNKDALAFGDAAKGGAAKGGAAKGPQKKSGKKSKKIKDSKDKRQIADGWMALGNKAANTRQCETALSHYNRALLLDPSKKAKVASRIRTCIQRLAQKGETILAGAEKANPALAGFFAERRAQMREAEETDKTVAKRKAAKRKKPAAKPSKRAKERVKKKSAVSY